VKRNYLYVRSATNSSSDLEPHCGRLKNNGDAAKLSSTTSDRQPQQRGAAAGWEAGADECDGNANRQGLGRKHQLYKQHLINILHFLNIFLY